MVGRGHDRMIGMQGLGSEDPAAVTIRLSSPLVADCVHWLLLWGLAVPAPDALERRRRRGEPDAGAAAEPAAKGRYLRPDPESRLLNASRFHAGRQALVDQGTCTVREIASAQGRATNTVHQRVRRACRRGALFTVAFNGETHVPAVLLDEALEARACWAPVVSALSKAGMSGWGIWRWIAEPNAGLSGEIAADVIEADPERVYAAAKRRATQLAE